MPNLINLTTKSILQQQQSGQAAPINQTIFTNIFGLVYGAVVGSATQVANGIANYTDLQAALTAASPGSNILVLAAYAPLSENIVLAANVNIAGQGESTVLTTGTFTIPSGINFCSITQCKFGNNLSIASNGCYIQGWQTTGYTISNTGTANALIVVQE